METMCPHCARPRTAADARGLAWSSVHGPGGSVWFLCPDCTRNQLPDIEIGATRLPPMGHAPAA
jgi:hypothetical protein